MFVCLNFLHLTVFCRNVEYNLDAKTPPWRSHTGGCGSSPSVDCNLRIRWISISKEFFPDFPIFCLQSPSLDGPWCRLFTPHKKVHLSKEGLL